MCTNKRIQERKLKLFYRRLMNISLTARHFEASQNLKDFCTDSVDKLTLFYDRIVSCDIILEPTPSDKAPQKVDLIIKVPKKIITVSESAESYEKAMGTAVDIASRQLKRYKEKLYATS